jgi:DNA polymerase-3 subunit chi
VSGNCQVDFYLLGSAAMDANSLACRLAAMAWERGHSIDIVTGDEQASRQLDDLMWAYPEGRFLPHERSAAGATQAPVRIHLEPPAGRADVVINLTTTPLEQPDRFTRLLEIVPHQPAEREASRNKFRAYRAAGLEPATHEINQEKPG